MLRNVEQIQSEYRIAVWRLKKRMAVGHSTFCGDCKDMEMFDVFPRIIESTPFVRITRTLSPSLVVITLHGK